MPLSFSRPQLRLKSKGSFRSPNGSKSKSCLDGEEMSGLLETLHPVHFVVVSEPVADAQADHLLSTVPRKIPASTPMLLKGGKRASTETRAVIFPSAMTKSLDPFYAIPAGQKNS